MQMDWVSEKVQRLIEEGQQALSSGKEVVLTEGDDSEFAAVDDGKDQIDEDEYGDEGMNKANRRGELGHCGRPSSALSTCAHSAPDPSGSSSSGRGSWRPTAVGYAAALPRSTSALVGTTGRETQRGGSRYSGLDDDLESAELREQMEKVREAYAVRMSPGWC